MMLLIFLTGRTSDIGRTKWDLRHLRQGLATWTCDTRDMDLRHLRHGLATCELLKSGHPHGQDLAIRLTLPPRPDSMAVTDGAFAVIVMVTRAEYLAGSFSRLQPWLAEGISRRQWERRRKITAATGGPAATPSAATSASAKAARTPLRRNLTTNVESPANMAPRAAVSTADHISPPPAQIRTPLRHDEYLILRLFHDYWDAEGMSPNDPEALAKAIHTIKFPEPFKHMDARALGKRYRRARARFPGGYDRWVDLVEKWDPSYDRRKARNLVDRLVTAVGDRPAVILDRLFASLEQQVCHHLKKVRRLELEYNLLIDDPCYVPQLRPSKIDAIKEQVYAALADGPKTIRELARMFGKTDRAMSAVGLRLRTEGKITSIWRRGHFMWARASTKPRFIPARDAIVEALKKGPMTVSALARETGKGIPTIKSALHRHLLANKTVIRTKRGVYALAGTQSPYVSRGDAIVAALKKGPMSFQALAREINNPPSSVPQFLEPLLAKGKVIRIKRGIYALHGRAPAYMPTSDAIISALIKKPMKLGPLVQHVIELTKNTRSRSSIRTVLPASKGWARSNRSNGMVSIASPRACARCGEERERAAEGI
jgi:hypothetical protein